jgi:choline dehydrogenase
MSPAILQRSGIGPPDELERLGVDRVVDLPGVGTNLLDHPMVDVTFESRELVEPAAIHGFQDVLLKARSSRCSDEHWDTHVLLFVFLPDEDGIAQIILSVGVVQSNSIGRIRLPSADPEVVPDLVQPFSALSDHDTAVLVEGIALIRRLAWTRALGRFVGNELEPGQGGDLESWVRANAAGYGTRWGRAAWVPRVIGSRWSIPQGACTARKAWWSPMPRSSRRLLVRIPTSRR